MDMRDEIGSFAVFADHLNFTTAAKALNLSQPALHAAIRKLEADLGRKLYVRNGRALVLTGDGETMARYARDSRTRLQRFLSEFTGGRRDAPIVVAASLFGFKHVATRAIRA